MRTGHQPGNHGHASGIENNVDRGCESCADENVPNSNHSSKVKTPKVTAINKLPAVVRSNSFRRSIKSARVPANSSKPNREYPGPVPSGRVETPNRTIRRPGRGSALLALLRRR